MKKFIFCLTLILCFALAACTAVPAEAPAQAPAAEATEAPADEATEPSAPAEAATPDAAEQLMTILVDTAVNYYPGTAGSSLNAAKYAAEIMDWFAASGVDADAIRETVSSFYGALDADTAKAFVTEKVGDVYGAAKELTKDLLESAGYEPTAFPYAAEDITSVFTAIYEGIGQQLPA